MPKSIMGMVDIHTHILPGIDDGSKSWETTLAMCEIAAQDGITHIVATPHANDQYHYDRKAHEAKLAELRAQFTGPLEFSLGCDFHLSFENISAARANPSEFCIGDTGFLLVEFSDFAVSRQLVGTLEEFVDSGLTPIVTHPERNRILQSSPEMILEMARIGCLIQVTANSLTGFWGPTARKTAEWLLKKDSVHILASDSHDSERRTPVLSKGRDAAAVIVGQQIADLLVTDNPAAVLRGTSLV